MVLLVVSVDDEATFCLCIDTARYPSNQLPIMHSGCDHVSSDGYLVWRRSSRPSHFQSLPGAIPAQQ